MNYLLQFTVGEAKRIVSDYLYQDAERGSKAELKELKDRKGYLNITALAYDKTALEWPTMNQAMQKLEISLLYSYVSFKSLNQVSNLSSPRCSNVNVMRLFTIHRDASVAMDIGLTINPIYTMSL